MPPSMEPSDRLTNERVPVAVITGFLGSGKTTLLNRLVRHPGMADTALIVNEFGEIGIDHELVDSAFENTVMMDSGCICCSIRGDLVDTVGDLFTNVALGKLPPFSRLVIETTGLADPVPIVHALTGEPVVADRCRLDSVVTTVDAQNADRQLREHEEAARQVALADVALITKTDLAAPETAQRLARRLLRLNPGLPIYPVLFGEIDPDLLFDIAGRTVESIAGGVPGGSEEPAHANAGYHDHDHDHGHVDNHDHDRGHDPDVNRHGDIRAYTIQAESPLRWDRLRLWLETVFSLRGADFLRLKGIVQVCEDDRPVVLQAVGNHFSPPRALAKWPGGGPGSRIVLITRGLAPEDLQRSFEAFVVEGIAEPAC
jgi:G3E family GTPase